MQLTLALPDTTSKKIVELARLINRSPEATCVIFIEDGVKSYSTENDIAELRETIDAQP